MSIHPSTAYDVARLRHAESVSRADRLARAQGFDPAGRTGAGPFSWLLRSARLARRRRAATVPAAHGLPAPASTEVPLPAAR